MTADRGLLLAASRPPLEDPRAPAASEPAGRDARRELRWTRMALLTTYVVSVAVAVFMTVIFGGDVERGRWGQALLAGVADASIAALVSGGLVYHWARWGHYRRLLDAEAALPGGSDDPDGLFDPDADPGLLTVLIPSYREDLEVVRQTVLSAALQDYPDRRVVILVDDPPAPSAPEYVAALAAVRALPDEVQDLLCVPARVLAEEERAFAGRTRAGAALDGQGLGEEARRVEALYERAASWFQEQTDRQPARDHTGRLFIELTFAARAAACRQRAQKVAAARATGAVSVGLLAREHRRLARMFAVQVAVFERKRYANLSHAANKAMNLNAYIGLLDARWKEVPRTDGLHLEPDAIAPAMNGSSASVAGAVLEVPASRWLLTVDADSLLVHDYAARLVASMGRPEHARVAVMQTPYSAVPGATAPVERTAGATTDIMHLVHQGTTHFQATYWVGANALLRTAALADIEDTAMEGRTLVRRFIQDRTVIEDTESTVDLIDAGWQLHNYPARLAYSATPADYGSLLIQRRRWANGGLIILPKLIRSLLRSGLCGRVAEGLMRVHYLVSIAAANLALLILTLVPFTQDVPVLLLAATSIPYFALYARDLRLLGRRRRGLLGVYALNLLMLPVNLGGVLMSIRQGLTGQRIPFGRTPKVADRTAAPARYIALTLALLALWCTGAIVDCLAGRYLHAAMVGANAVVLAAATTRYIGWRHALADLTAPLRARLHAPRQRPGQARDLCGAHSATRAQVAHGRPGPVSPLPADATRQDE